MPKKLEKKVKQWKEYILLLLAVFNIIGIGLAAYITLRLAPLTQNIAVLATEIQANEALDEKDHATFITRDTFNEVVTRIDHISSRVDSIYSIVLRK